MCDFLSLLMLPPVFRGFIGMIISGGCFPLWGVMILKLKLIPLRYMLMHGVILGGAIALGMNLPTVPVIIFTNLVLVILMILVSKNHSFGFSGGSAAIMVISMALASVISHVKSIEAKDSLDLLWGSPFALKSGEIILLILLLVGTIVFLVVNFRNVLCLFFNDEIAKAMGVKVGLNYSIIVMIIAVIVAVGMKLLGAFLIDSLLLLPVLCAASLLKSFSKKSGVKRLFGWSGVLGVLFSTIGYLMAVAVDCPPSAVIALFSGLCFVIAGVGEIIKRKVCK